MTFFPDFRLYLITDRHVTGETRLLEALTRCLEGGVRAIQLREKDLELRELCRLGEKVRELTNRYGARLYVNDRADVALGIGADGVHLTTRSMPPGALRDVFGERLSVGVSTHRVEEIRAAAEGGADFVTFGPVYETASKRAYGPPLGVEGLRTAVRDACLPVFALGGISVGRLHEVMKTGCHGVALISGILGAPDIRREAESYTRKLI